MPDCCGVGDLDDVFSASRAAKDARRYLRKGLAQPSRGILDALVDRGVAGGTVLEIGGGVGALQVELLRAGIARVTNVELSRSYEAAAQDLLECSGLTERADRTLGDFVDAGAGVAPADAVVLDRVLCCYPDAPRLLAEAAAHARSILAMTIPVDRWWMRAARTFINVRYRVTGSSFRFYVHDTNDVIATVESHGLRVATRRGRTVWQLLMFAR